MKVISTRLDGILVVEPHFFKDQRGFLFETYQYERYQAAGIKDNFVQDNQSRSEKGVLRGLHFQVKPQAQLVSVLRGRVFDVVVDLRQRSKTFGQWFGIELSDINPKQVYMAPGFAHGFCVLSDWADLYYKVSRYYNPDDEGGVIWNDPGIDIQWPIDMPKVASRDAAFPCLQEMPQEKLPYGYS